MARIVIISGIQVVDNPRVVKEADALSEAGHEVEVLAALYEPDAAERVEELLEGRNWRHTPVLDLVSRSIADRMTALGSRALYRLARAGKSLFDMELPDQLGPATRRLYAMARRRPADLYISHLPQALWSGVKLLRDGRRVAIDVEDWYSEDGLPEDRARQPVRLLKLYERNLLSGAAYATTTSAALSGALARDYSVAAPHVVYNSFPVRDGCGAGEADTDRIDPSIPSITWFSQTIGPGRGLEALIAALELVPEPFEVHIRGAARPGYREALLAPASQRLRARVHFHDRVSQDELARRLAEHDIGYCGELSDCANRDLTITNKVFEYMRAGLAIVASDTAGQVEIARRAPGSMSLFRQGDVGDLSEKLRELVRTPLALAQAKKASRLALEEHFNWRDQKGTIQGLADAALALPANCRSVAACDA